MKNSIIILTLFLSLLFISCNSYKYGASNESTKSSNLTHGVVKSKIIKGETKQNEILELFGAPNITTKNKSNNEVWSYNRMSSVDKGGKTTFFSGSKGSSSTSMSSFDLIVTFDSDDIVIDYSVISTKF